MIRISMGTENFELWCSELCKAYIYKRKRAAGTQKQARMRLKYSIKVKGNCLLNRSGLPFLS